MSEFLKTNEVATALGIGRESARLLMKRTPVPHHVLGDRGLRDVDAEFA